jgi:hypothetical protein
MREQLLSDRPQLRLCVRIEAVSVLVFVHSMMLDMLDVSGRSWEFARPVRTTLPYSVHYTKVSKQATSLSATNTQV